MTYNIYIRPEKCQEVSQWLMRPFDWEPSFTKNDICLTKTGKYEKMVSVTITSDEFTNLYDFIYGEQEKTPQNIDRDLITGEFLKRTGADPKMSYHPITQETESDVYLISTIIEEYYNVTQK